MISPLISVEFALWLPPRGFRLEGMYLRVSFHFVFLLGIAAFRFPPCSFHLAASILQIPLCGFFTLAVSILRHPSCGVQLARCGLVVYVMYLMLCGLRYAVSSLWILLCGSIFVACSMRIHPCRFHVKDSASLFALCDLLFTSYIPCNLSFGDSASCFSLFVFLFSAPTLASTLGVLRFSISMLMISPC